MSSISINGDLAARLTQAAAEARLPVEGYLTQLLNQMERPTQPPTIEDQLKLYARAIEATTTGILIADATQFDFPLIYANPAFTAITGYSASEVIGKNCRFLRGNDADQPGLDVLRSAIHAGEACHVVIRNYRKDGTLFWNELRIAPIHDTTGRLTHFIGVQNEITRQVELQAALEISQHRYRMISEMTSDYAYAFQVQPDGSLVREWVTDAYRIVTEYTPEEITALGGWMALMHPDDLPEAKANLARLLTEKVNITSEYRIVTKSGQSRNMISQLRPVSEDGSGNITHIYGVAKDITAEKHLEQERLNSVRLKAELDAANELAAVRERFTGMLMHEFRTPLTVLGTSIYLLTANLERQPYESTLERLRTIDAQVTRMRNLIDDMLLLSQSEHGKLMCAPTVFDIRQECQAIVGELEMIEQKEHQFRLDVAQDVEAVDLDARLVRHILTNLLTNAVKFSPPASQVTLHVERRAQELILAVEDQGMGIAPADQQHLFEPFFRTAQANRILGTGLGLTIVQRSVEAHGGSIEIESQLGVGTTFRVHLPEHQAS